jgi:hypothetical protein
MQAPPTPARTERRPSVPEWWQALRNLLLLPIGFIGGVVVTGLIFGPLPDSPVSGGVIGLCVFGCYFVMKWSVEALEFLLLRITARRMNR